MRKRLLLATVLLGVGMASTSALAQQRGNRGQFDPEQMRQQMTERMKEDLKVTDEEWQVIQPLLEKVTTAQRAGMGGRFGGMRGGRTDRRGGGTQDEQRGGTQGEQRGGTQGEQRGGQRGGQRGEQVDTPTSQAMAALRETLESEDASAADIKEKVATLRKAREANAAELKQARDALRKVLSVRQEAVLVARGTLD